MTGSGVSDLRPSRPKIEIFQKKYIKLSSASTSTQALVFHFADKLLKIQESRGDASSSSEAVEEKITQPVAMEYKVVNVTQ